MDCQELNTDAVYNKTESNSRKDIYKTSNNEVHEDNKETDLNIETTKNLDVRVSILSDWIIKWIK